MDNLGGHVAPFWRACAGGAFGLIIGGVWLSEGFWSALFLLVCLVVGALVGIVAMGYDEA